MGWSGEARGSHGGLFWRCARTFPLARRGARTVWLGDFPAVRRYHTSGMCSGVTPHQGLRTRLMPDTLEQLLLLSLSSDPAKMKPIRNLLRPLRGEVAAYVRGTGLIRGLQSAALSDL